MTTAALKDICTVFGDGDWIESKDQSAHGIRLIQTGNVGLGVFKDRIEKARWISEETFKRLRCTEISEGDVLISRLPDPVGRACILPALKHKAITAVDCSIVRFKQEIMDPRFFVYYSQSSVYASSIEPLISGSTRQRISREKLGTIQIPLPSLKKQREIVEKLDSAFVNIDLLEGNLALSDEKANKLLQTLLSAAFTSSVGIEEPSNPSANHGLAMNEIFKVGTIEDMCNVEYGTRVVRKKDAGTMFPVYGGGGETFFLDTFNREDRVVIARFAMSQKCTRRVSGKFALNDSGLTLSPRDKDILRQDYLDYYVLGLNDQIFDSARGTAQKNLDVPAFRQMKVIYPESLEKQHEIVKKLDNAFVEIDLLKAQLRIKQEYAAALRQSLLSNAFAPEEAVA